MSRTYLFALTDGGGGTVAPELGVARRLVDRGHRVTVLAEDSMAPAVAATGAAFQRWRHGLNRPDHLPEHAPYQEWALRSPTTLVRQMIAHLVVGPAAGYARDVTDAIRADRPDLVLTSFFAFGAMVAAQAAQTPFDVLMPNIYPLPAPGLPPFGPGLRLARGPLGGLRDRVFGVMSQRLWDGAALPGLNEVRGAYGLSPVAHYQDQVHHARRQLVLTSAEFDFPAELPPSVRYVGPVLDDPAWAPGSWQPPPGDEPLVLVSMSTTFQDQAACLQRVVDALATLPVRGLVTTGPVIDPASITAPPSVTVVAAAPHAAVLRQAALVVTHGGHGTLVKAFAAGVPVVILPHGRDQPDNAARVAHHGAGRSIARTASPAKIADTVRRVLADPDYRLAATRLGTALRRDAGSGLLLAEIDGPDTADLRPAARR
ncbi:MULTISPECIES: nucleotide disphospho-sugar-binding domain-containing protein [Pseudofrankia]|uniref:nucleotide disphospho-sugar-binding domain-containing protein n=1 Tax=Pseudofrankia TaxID=2994363 RepID=UPI000234B983|nr:MULTISPECIES: nucleotide disphospho-sugar-binding domain-containing protein [Pseudofrankia]OHV35983.1 glycosyl transferase [Pseudofrankia sp. EUN1h]